jgi:hypothetical protein
VDSLQTGIYIAVCVLAHTLIKVCTHNLSTSKRLSVVAVYSHTERGYQLYDVQNLWIGTGDDGTTSKRLSRVVLGSDVS